MPYGGDVFCFVASMKYVMSYSSLIVRAIRALSLPSYELFCCQVFTVLALVMSLSNKSAFMSVDLHDV